MVSTFWNIPGIQSHQSLEFLERSLSPLCLYDQNGHVTYASQSFLDLLNVTAETVAFFAYFPSESTSLTVLTSLWESALKGEVVNFLAKTQDDTKGLECSLSFNTEMQLMFLTAHKSVRDALAHQPPEEHEPVMTAPAHTSLAMALVHQDGLIVKANSTFHALLKTDEQEALLLDSLVHPNDRLSDAALKQKLLNGDINTYSIEKRFIAKNNDILWINISVSLTRATGNDRPSYFEYVLDDRTERHNVFSALVRTEEKWQALILNSPYLFIQTSNAGQIVYTSAAVEQLLGYKEEELLGRHVTELLHPNHFNEFELVLQLWASDVQPHQSDVECWWRAKSGRWVALSVRGQGFPSSLNVDGVMISGHNITDRKCLEMELKASEEQFRSLTLNLPGAAFRCNAVYTMSFISDGIEAMSGYAAAALINNQARSFLGIVHPDDIAILKDSLIQSVLDCRRCSIEYRLIHANGQIRWVSERKQGVFDPNGNLLWLDGVLLDISDRKQAEAELRRCAAVNQALVAQCPDLMRSVSVQIPNSFKPDSFKKTGI